MKLLRILFLASLFPAIDTDAQESSATGAGSRPFPTGGGRSFWMGANYRKEWNTSVKAPFVNLATEHGGLTVTKRGGGKQTKSLRLEDAEGREYTLRSIQKFITSKTLPGDLQSEAAADLVADGISASYPYGALSVPVLAQAAGIPHGEVKLVFIPDDPKLGEFRSDFANMLALYEARMPDSVKKDYDTEEVVEKLKDDNDNRVDQMAMLKLRILDMFIMDLDRHEDQWNWGAWDNGKGKTYYPVAKDRDQAFYINQGVIPGIAQWPWLVPQLEGFKPKAKNIKRFNFAARNVDRFFLNELSEAQWQKAVNDFLSQMTDEVIDKAMDQQPPEVRGYSADKIKKTLKERRKYLAADVMEYYEFLSEIVRVTGSDKTEFFDITRNDDGSMLVQVYKITKEGEQSSKMYERLFEGKDTKEVELYGFGGNDKFIIKGTEDKIKLRMIGGEGEDLFENTGKSGKGGIVYDRKDESNKIVGKLKDKTANDTIVNSFKQIYYQYNQVIPFVSVGFNRDDGLFLGGWMKIIHHGFRKEPFKNSHTITINHALATNAWNFKYNSEYIGTFGRKSDLVFDADIKAPHNTTNFFGYGMNSVYDENKPGKFRYYRARYEMGDLSLLLRKNFSQRIIMTLGPTFQFYKLDKDDKFNNARFITDIVANELNPATLYAKQSYLGGKFGLTIDYRNNPIIPQKGVYWQTTVRHLSGLNDASYNVTQLNSDFTFHIPLVKNILVLSDRFGGGHNFGDFEFYQAQYLGSEDNLRGYRKYRFAGRSKFYNNVEMRLKVANFKTYLFPGALGILAFYDAGRVWTDAEEAKDGDWATGYGAGFWFSPLRRIVLTFTYTASKEDKLPLIGIGWKF